MNNHIDRCIGIRIYSTRYGKYGTIVSVEMIEGLPSFRVQCVDGSFANWLYSDIGKETQ